MENLIDSLKTQSERLGGIAMEWVQSPAAWSQFGLLVVAFGWRNIMLVSAVATFAVCAGVWLIVRDTFPISSLF